MGCEGAAGGGGEGRAEGGAGNGGNAVMLDQPEGTVKSRIRSGLRRMRDQLSDAGVSGAWTES